MSVFEDKIRRNQSYFNDHEPEKGHEVRFIRKLDTLKSVEPRRVFSKTFLSIAAGFIILVSAGTIIFRFIMKEKTSQQTIIGTINYSENLENVLAYYDAVSLQKVKEIDNYIPDTTEALKIKKIALDRLHDIDGSFASIEKELVKNPDDENVKSALINTKRKKVEVMDDILLQLDFANSSLF